LKLGSSGSSNPLVALRRDGGAVSFLYIVDKTVEKPAEKLGLSSGYPVSLLRTACG
jgi:hypothetical protein